MEAEGHLSRQKPPLRANTAVSRFCVDASAYYTACSRTTPSDSRVRMPTHRYGMYGSIERRSTQRHTLMTWTLMCTGPRAPVSGHCSRTCRASRFRRCTRCSAGSTCLLLSPWDSSSHTSTSCTQLDVIVTAQDRCEHPRRYFRTISISQAVSLCWSGLCSGRAILLTIVFS